MLSIMKDLVSNSLSMWQVGRKAWTVVMELVEWVMTDE